MKLKYFYLFITVLFLACNQKLEEVDFVSNNCPATAPFISKHVKIANGVALSTTEPKFKGLWIVNALVPEDKKERLLYQDSSWKMAGWLGPLLTDKKGNVWCTPIPVINVLDNPTTEQNNIYKVDPISGKMEMFLQLPLAEKISVENPYGIMGIAYNCEAEVLYVSTVAGSTRNQQNGKIYAIDIANKKILSTLNCGDAFGLGVSFKDGFRKLYFGSARNSNIYAIGLKENGSFIGDFQLAFSLEGLGPRGDDKARKIREDKQGNLIVSGFEFNFNLTAPTEKQEFVCNFVYNVGQEKWVYKNSF